MSAEGEKSLVRAATAVTAATFLSRVLGLAREQVVAYLFGAVRETDAFNVAFRIPNLLRDLFAEGALSAAFVPTFTEIRTTRGESEAWLLANRVINALAALLTVLTILIVVFARPIVLALAPGFSSSPGKTELAAEMARIMSPFLLFIALASVMMGVLNTYGRFFVPSFAPAIFNISCIVFAILLTPVLPRFGISPIVSLALGAVLGAVGQFAIQIPAAARCGFRYQATLTWKDPWLRRMVKLMLPATIGLSATQIAILVDTQFASSYGDGAVSVLGYAFRLIQLPIGLFGVAIATANLAAVSRRAAVGDMEGLKANVARAVRLAAFLTLPATAGLIALSEPIVRVLYEHGRFTSARTEETARVLLLYTVGLFAYSVVKILVPTFYALKDTKVPVRSSIIAVAAKVALNFPLTWYFERAWGANLGYAGLALSTAASAVVNLTLLSVALRRRVGSFASHALLGTCARIALASLGVGIAAKGVYVLLAPAHHTGRLAETLALAAGIAAGVAVLAAASRILGISEMTDLTARFLPRRLRGSDGEPRG